ncbi:hypothetical protein CMQ_7012 [Grosmannia clavigera kw1407]|uniref:DUF7924 domain-containing protein n=1 Tax=Grosmannia clavigera (strain kw1407 / UAMH 11150) TaxID=655863 RepID=F0X6V8_GROCL|nr:uncharacterized protein CMQ_7012 [Grosmannia clavigera kw1407]EFX06691.1 hypothetical protein CMQ_7012 [Grosmannia clavigera kw1407]
MTEEATVKPVPDFFDGARPESIDKAVRDDLSQLITPTKHASVPVAPNFFLEVKGPGGSFGVALRQALHDGAVGARAMHALQNYGKDEVEFDGHAYSYSSIYQAGSGLLQLYGHHITAPTAPGGPPYYHMTLFESLSMIGSREHFVKGAAAFRNARDLAQKLRNWLIQAANTRARQLRLEEQQYAESARDEVASSATSFSSRSSPNTQSESGVGRERTASHSLGQNHGSIKRRAR